MQGHRVDLAEPSVCQIWTETRSHDIEIYEIVLVPGSKSGAKDEWRLVFGPLFFPLLGDDLVVVDLICFVLYGCETRNSWRSSSPKFPIDNKNRKTPTEPFSGPSKMVIYVSLGLQGHTQDRVSQDLGLRGWWCLWCFLKCAHSNNNINIRWMARFGNNTARINALARSSIMLKQNVHRSWDKEEGPTFRHDSNMIRWYQLDNWHEWQPGWQLNETCAH